MFNLYSTPVIEENFFVNANYSKNIESILPTAELIVNFRLNGLKAQKNCFVYAEKLEFKGLIVRPIQKPIDKLYKILSLL